MSLKTYLAVVIFAQGCATVHNGRHQEIGVVSDPAGANVEVRCGKMQPAAVTPATVRLPRRVEQCSLILTRPGFHAEGGVRIEPGRLVLSKLRRADRRWRDRCDPALGPRLRGPRSIRAAIRAATP